MEKVDIKIEKVDSLRELESKVNKEHLILCDDIQNAYIIINFDNIRKMGIAYYDYGVIPKFQCFGDETLLYFGIGMTFFCINTYENKVLVNDNLQSVFYELCCDLDKNYICVICELDVYCYCAEKQKWKMGFINVIVDCNIVDDTKIAILCEGGAEYVFFLENGKLAE